ncbi:AzlD family protein [Gallibacterium anatis]|uniref:AzlD family protein n=1 Tax=Gallibacterium anatis TaxID=750 RepID=A0A930US66_9PAST|nr:AzlD family protein [Gallibacterium anatis]
MATVTCSTRLLGFFLLQKKRIKSDNQKTYWLKYQRCVLISVIAPEFTSSNPADWIRINHPPFSGNPFSFLPTVIIGIIATGVLDIFLG